MRTSDPTRFYFQRTTPNKITSHGTFFRKVTYFKVWLVVKDNFRQTLFHRFIYSCLPSIMQQCQDFRLNPFKICHCTTCFGLLGHHQVRWIGGNCFAFRATVIGVSVFTVFLKEVNVVPPSVPKALFVFLVCLSSVPCGCFNAPNDDHVGRNMQCSDEFKKWFNFKILISLRVGR
jgi:hypothetical protein